VSRVGELLDWRVPTDPAGAFVDGPGELLAGVAGGPLDGCRLAVKDVIDVAGRTTGAGNPTFAAGAAPAACSAPVVERLVAGGATVVGRTVTDELAYSLSGTNVHLGTPRNAAWPGHEPGGSSSGSAAAVAAGAADIGLGTDTGGSIRVPASYCRLLGWRPTHGLLPVDGVVPLSASFDTVGVLVRSDDTDLLPLVAGVLGVGDEVEPVRALVVEERLLGLVGAADRADLLTEAARLAACLGVPVTVRSILPAAPGEVAGAFRALQGAEAWAAHGAAVCDGLDLGPGIAARFAAASSVSPAEVAAASEVRAAVRDALVAATADGHVLVQAAAAGPPPSLTGADPVGKEQRRAATIALTAPAGLAGAPVLVLPTRPAGEAPFGLALVGARWTDRSLLAILGARAAA
jgi:Asp-tRNA(Asn)/Glu-tRNA(Gln) amidotransferase A subunit family amidase